MVQISIPSERGQQLIQIARQAVFEAVAGQTFDHLEAESWLREQGATFVTLTCGEKLRGCVGSLEPYRPLLEDLRENACSAALRDPRFPPVSSFELDDLEVEVSVLSDLEEIECDSEADLLQQLHPGEDGLVLEWRDERGTFLPQVWDGFPDPAAFLGRLKEKVGLLPEFWDPEIRVWRYTVAKWRQAEIPS